MTQPNDFEAIRQELESYRKSMETAIGLTDNVNALSEAIKQSAQLELSCRSRHEHNQLLNKDLLHKVFCLGCITLRQQLTQRIQDILENDLRKAAATISADPPKTGLTSGGFDIQTELEIRNVEDSRKPKDY